MKLKALRNFTDSFLGPIKKGDVFESDQPHFLAGNLAEEVKDGRATKSRRAKSADNDSKRSDDAE